MNTLPPVGRNLPPKRLAAAAAPARVPLRDSIIVETARDRLWDQFERQLMPQDVRNILSSAITGDSWEWEKLYTAMLDSWPRLQKNLSELQREVRGALWRVKPAAELDEKPDAAAESAARECSRMLWGCQPRPAYAEGGLEDLMEWLTTAYFTGIGVSEIAWQQAQGEWRPRAFRPVSSRHYGYSNHGNEEEDRLMLRREVAAFSDFEDFPEHRFLIAIHGGHPGHPTTSAPLRVLTGYWLAAVFGLEWFMKFAQLFGVPLRWATYTDENSKPAMIQMMEQLGNGAWGVGPADAKVEFAEPGKAAAALPQAELLRLADEQCDIFMLGQTLTSSTGGSGSRALGDVHADTKRGVVRGVCDFVGRVITSQLIPAWSYWNAGAVAEMLPEFFPEWPEAKDEKAMAERDETLGLTSGRTPVARAWFYERYKIPVPQPGDELLVPPVLPVPPTL